MLLVCGFSALGAEKPHTEDEKYHTAVRPEAPLSWSKGAVEGQAKRRLRAALRNSCW